MPLMSVGSHKGSRTSMTSRPVSSPICLTMSLLPMPGGPHRNAGRRFWMAFRIAFLAFLGPTVRIDLSLI